MRPARVVAGLGTAQLLAWGSSYYLPAVLAAPMARTLGLATSSVYLAFSVSLVLSAAVGPAAGRWIDRHGGRRTLPATSMLFALGLAVLASAQGPLSMTAGWLLLGLAMGSGLYEAAFAALVHLYGHGARNPIVGVTLLGGLASTVGWPLSAWMESRWGWRGACAGWALLHLSVGLPLNARLPRAALAGAAASIGAADAPAAPTRAAAPAAVAPVADAARVTALLAFVFAATWFVSTAMASHLPRLLQAAGVAAGVAVAIGATVGPAQVAGRLLEYGWLRRLHPLLSARLAALGHPAGALLLLAMGPLAAPLFAVLHGAGNGIMTIAKGTLPLAFFGPQGYGVRQGWLMMPTRIAQAAAPVTFGLALDRWGIGTLAGSAALGLAAFAALLVLRVPAGSAPR